MGPSQERIPLAGKARAERSQFVPLVRRGRRWDFGSGHACAPGLRKRGLREQRDDVRLRASGPRRVLRAAGKRLGSGSRQGHRDRPRCGGWRQADHDQPRERSLQLRRVGKRDRRQQPRRVGVRRFPLPPNIVRPVQERRLGKLRRFREPGRLRQLRGDRGEEPASESAAVAARQSGLLDSPDPAGVGHASHRALHSAERSAR